jgi:hypothetical protein
VDFLFPFANLDAIVIPEITAPDKRFFDPIPGPPVLANGKAIGY